jgi:hypothetical protein
VRVKYDGYSFDSIDECERYKVLKLLAKNGNISNLKVHPKYILQESFVTRKGKKIRAIFYEADFEYIDGETGDVVVEDVKGAKTRVFMLKEKMFLNRYPDLEITLVKGE